MPPHRCARLTAEVLADWNLRGARLFIDSKGELLMAHADRTVQTVELGAEYATVRAGLYAVTLAEQIVAEAARLV
jgi:hypothetical protein